MIFGGILFALASAAPVRAVSGFTGRFSLDSGNWVPQILLDGSLREGDCFDDIDLGAYACVVFNAETGDLDLAAGISSDSEVQSIDLTLTWTNKPEWNTGYFVSFDWQVDAAYVAGLPTATLSVGSAPPFGSSVSTNQQPFGPGLVGSGQTLSFKVAAVNNSSLQLSIKSFNGTEVPAPLPAAGAASVFACSRRLRRRVQGRGRQSAPPPPSAYLSRALHLPADALPSLPLSFDYTIPGETAV